MFVSVSKPVGVEDRRWTFFYCSNKFAEPAGHMSEKGLGWGGGGPAWEFLVGLCRPVLQFSHPFSDLASKELFHHYLDKNSKKKKKDL